jgi:acetyl-CoA carboxylase biotin carboxyl carrier protein
MILFSLSRPQAPAGSLTGKDEKMDLKELYALMEKFEASGLTELQYKAGDGEVCLKKGAAGGTPIAFMAPQPMMQAAQAPVMQPPAGQGAPPPAAEARPAEGEVIRSPIVGTFYRAAAPDAAPFVEAGATVKKGQTLCILEAMKLMNEFQAEFDLVVVKILADNGKMVEFGTPLFEVRRV